MSITVNQTTLDYIKADAEDKWGQNITYAIDVNFGTLDFDPKGWDPNTIGTSANNQSMIREAFELWDDVIAGSITEAPGDEDADITVNTVDNMEPNKGGVTYSYPYVGWDSDVFLRPNMMSLGAVPDPSNPGSFIYNGAFRIALHEIGHSLGLMHAGNYDATDAQTPTYANNASSPYDTRQFSIMSYFDPNNYQSNINWFGSHGPETPMIYDILAIQSKYGASTDTRLGDTNYGFNNNSGRDVFSFSLNDVPVFTILDNGGDHDRIDASGFSAAQIIDLGEGTYSDIGGYRGNVGIAFGTWIEHAIGGSGQDEIRGNQWNNYLEGRNGNDDIYGFQGFDNLFGGNGNDDLYGGTGTDYLDGGSDQDFLRGDDDNDTLMGGDGDDHLFGGRGTNTIDGGAGNDTYYIGEWSSNGFDVITDSSGSDTASYYAATTINFQTNSFAGGALYATFSQFEIENFDGSLYDDVFIMNSQSLDSHRLRGYGGNDSLVGGFVNDDLNGGNGDDTLDGGGGNDALTGGRGTNYLRGGSGSDTYYLGGFPDPGFGDAGVWGIDYITDINGIDDTVVYANASTLNWRDGIYTGDQAHAYFLPDGGIEHLIGSAQDDTFVMLTATTVNWTLEGAGGNDSIAGGSGADTITGGFGADTLDGGAGKDSLTGGDANDRIYGGAGNDSLFGDDGNDILYGGLGADLVNGGAGLDYARYDEQNYGDIKVSLNSAANAVLGTSAAQGDSFVGIEGLIMGSGNDWAYGSNGANWIYGGGGNDNLFGSNGADYLDGGAGLDYARFDDASYGALTADLAGTIANTGAAAGDTYVNIEGLILTGFGDKGYGNSGANYLYGLGGGDNLDGRAGADFLDGGIGNDTLTGGADNDIFKFRLGSGRDTINDFAGGPGVVDRINLQGTGLTTFAAVTAASVQVGTDLEIRVNASDVLVIKNFTLATLVSDDLIL